MIEAFERVIKSTSWAETRTVCMLEVMKLKLSNAKQIFVGQFNCSNKLNHCVYTLQILYGVLFGLFFKFWIWLVSAEVAETFERIPLLVNAFQSDIISTNTKELVVLVSVMICFLDIKTLTNEIFIQVFKNAWLEQWFTITYKVKQVRIFWKIKINIRMTILFFSTKIRVQLFKRDSRDVRR